MQFRVFVYGPVNHLKQTTLFKGLQMVLQIRAKRRIQGAHCEMGYVELTIIGSFVEGA